MIENWELHYAAIQGDVDGVASLLDQGYDPNAFDDISCTPLHHAAENGHIAVIKMLLQAGANVNIHDEPRIGNTALGHIAGNCSLAVAETLVKAGADPTIKGWMQLNALDRAKNRKKAEGRMVYDLLCQASRKFRQG